MCHIYFLLIKCDCSSSCRDRQHRVSADCAASKRQSSRQRDLGLRCVPADNDDTRTSRGRRRRLRRTKAPESVAASLRRQRQRMDPAPESQSGRQVRICRGSQISS